MTSSLVIVCLITFLGVTAALPTDVIIKLDPDIRYGLMPGPDGKVQVVDLWLTFEDLKEIARFDPMVHNVYHLFTRENPTTSQPLVYQNDVLLENSNFKPHRKTVFLMHGWMGATSSAVNTVLTPAYLAVEDMNVIVVDWSTGAGSLNYATAVMNTPISGRAVATFINWLNRVTRSSASSYYLVGHSLGGQKTGNVARHVDGDVAYIMALDPAGPGWVTNTNSLNKDDATLIEVLHTNSGILGALSDIGHLDFYPNGGINMPGCGASITCSHDRCIHYFGESILSGGFTGTRCENYSTAITGNCTLPETLSMGGLIPKTGSSGVYYLETNAAPPFSRD